MEVDNPSGPSYARLRRLVAVGRWLAHARLRGGVGLNREMRKRKRGNDPLLAIRTGTRKARAAPAYIIIVRHARRVLKSGIQ